MNRHVIRPHLPERPDLTAELEKQAEKNEAKAKNSSETGNDMRKEESGEVDIADVEPGRPESYIILPAGNYGGRDYPELLIGTNRITYADERVQGVIERIYPNRAFSDNDQGFLKDISYSDASAINMGIGGFTLPVLLFREFLRLLKSGAENRAEVYNGAGQKVDDEVLRNVYDDIVSARSPKRGEWLADRFVKENNEIQVITYAFDGNQLALIREPIKGGYLDILKTQGISLDAWLADATEQGYPKSDCPDGEVFYYPPTNGEVAKFYEDSDEANLFCGGDPNFRDSSLGVREARVRV